MIEKFGYEYIKELIIDFCKKNNSSKEVRITALEILEKLKNKSFLINKNPKIYSACVYLGFLINNIRITQHEFCSRCSDFKSVDVVTMRKYLRAIAEILNLGTFNYRTIKGLPNNCIICGNRISNERYRATAVTCSEKCSKNYQRVRNYLNNKKNKEAEQ